MNNLLQTLAILCYITIVMCLIFTGGAYVGGAFDQDDDDGDGYISPLEIINYANQAEAELIVFTTMLPETDLPVELHVLTQIPLWAGDNDVSGLTIKEPTKYMIYIICDNYQDIDVLFETLIHEWAHAMAWKKGSIEHGHYWGLAYAECWRIMIDEDEPTYSLLEAGN